MGGTLPRREHQYRSSLLFLHGIHEDQCINQISTSPISPMVSMITWGGGLSSICVNLPWHGFLTLFLFDVHKNGTTELHDNDLQNSKF